MDLIGSHAEMQWQLEVRHLFFARFQGDVGPEQ